MYDALWFVLFAAGCLTAIGAFVGKARGAASLLNLPIWWVLGDGVIVLETADGTSVGSEAVMWLCYLVATLSLLTLLVAVAEYYEADPDTADRQISASDL